MMDVQPEDLALLKRVLDNAIEQAEDMQPQLGGLEAYIARLEELRELLGE